MSRQNFIWALKIMLVLILVILASIFFYVGETLAFIGKCFLRVEDRILSITDKLL